MAIHEEGTGITWQQNIIVEPDTERYFLDTTETLYRRGLGYGGGTPESALVAVDELGRKLWETFLGDAGVAYLGDSRPTALLLDVDETTLNLPWELMAWNGNPLALEYPFGRIVRTRARPRPGRDPLQEDAEARILAVANPTPISPRPSARWRPSLRWPATTADSRLRWTCWRAATRPGRTSWRA